MLLLTEVTFHSLHVSVHCTSIAYNYQRGCQNISVKNVIPFTFFSSCIKQPDWWHSAAHRQTACRQDWRACWRRCENCGRNEKTS